ncbi:unnamed protein product, partial [Lymnaea stagnalis]
DYWSSGGPTVTPWFSTVMQRNRFFVILSIFHLSDIEAGYEQPIEERDKLFKGSPSMNLCLERFKAVYSPDQELAIDEAMCPFKGHLSFKVYNPNKPNKFGIKLYALCKSNSGYCLGFVIYSGQAT